MHIPSLIKINKKTSEPVYLQVAECLSEAIRNGILPGGFKLPGVKKMAQDTGLHSRTIEQVYEELDAQGWVTVKPHSGTYITDKPPVHSATGIKEVLPATEHKASFSFRKIGLPPRQTGYSKEGKKIYDIILNDGQPDIGYMPAVELEKNHRLLIRKKEHSRLFNKENAWGSFELRKALSRFLNDTRGLNTSTSNLLISKGNQFSIFLILSLTLTEQESIVFAEHNYSGVYHICRYLNLNIETVNTDQDGISLAELGKICTRKKIKAVYITPHIHYPTCVKLSEERRKLLLQVAEQYNFMIIEDDYDFDFHYNNAPGFPVAAYDNQKRVVYIGGLNRLISPTLRISYIAGPEDFLSELAKLKVSIDKFSDSLLEEALALTLKEAVIRRYRNKAVKYYLQKRDFLLRLLDKHLNEFCRYHAPEGGMAVWIEFNREFPIRDIHQLCMQKGLLLPERDDLYTYPPESNGIRIGFGNSSKAELNNAIQIIRQVITGMK